MPLRPDMDLRDYLEVLGRRKWLIVFSFLFVLFGAAVFIVVVPPQYKSTTTILIIPQRVPEAFVQSTVSIGVAGRLATIQQQVTSRTVLTKVMDELGLFPKRRQKALPEDIIGEMRKRIEIDVAQDRGRDRSTEAFSISFAYEDPKLAMLTASRLASLFIDENLRTREQQAVGTTEFLESQLQETKKKLEIQEERVKRYKLQYMGELPQEIQSNMNTLTRLQDYFRANAERMRAAEERKVFLESRLSALESSASPPQVSGGQTPQVAEDPARLLLQKRAQVADLASRYTDRYPDLVRLRREVTELEKRIKDTNKEAATLAAGNDPKVSDNTSPAANYLSDREREEMRVLKLQIASVDEEISRNKKESERIQKEIAAFQQKVDVAPRREQELIALTRDYDNLKSSYNELLRKRLDANISQNLEQRQKGEQFQVLDPANLPEKPFKPDHRKIFLIAFFIASALGFGGAVGLEMMDQTLREVKDFQHFFNVKVFATIPDIDNGAIARQQALRRGAIVGGFLLFLTTVTVFLWIYGEKVRAILKI